MAKSKAEHRLGIFFLVEPCAKYSKYRIGWYDKAKRQTRHVPTGTAVEQEALAALAEYHLKHSTQNGKTRKPTDEPLLQCLNRYYLNYLSKLPSGKKFKEYALPLAIEFFGEQGMVSDLTDEAQLRFIGVMRQRPTKLNGALFKDSTIKRVLGMWMAAVGYAVTYGHLDAAHQPKRIKAKKWKPRLKKGKVFLKPAQLQALFNAAARYEHQWRYLICAVATIGRVGAVRTLTGAQFDLDYRTINLLPEGAEQQDNKTKAIIPMCPTMERWARYWNTKGPICTWGGEALSTNTFWSTLARVSGVPCTAKNMRSTVISWLAHKGVPKWVRSIVSGHLRPDGNTQDDYTVLDPELARQVSDALEALFEAIAPGVKGDLLCKPIAENQPLPDEVWQGGYLPLTTAWGFQMLGSSPAPLLCHHATDGQFQERGSNVAAPPEGSFRFNQLASQNCISSVPAKDQVGDENQ